MVQALWKRRHLIPVGKAKFKFRPYTKSKPPERIGIKFSTVDHVHEICIQTKFGDNQVSGGLRRNM